MTLPHLGAPAADLLLARDHQRTSYAAWGSMAMLQALWAAHPERMKALNAEMPPQCAPVRRIHFAENTWSGSAQQADFTLKDSARDRIVKRDPCPRCGTRMDIGCAHVRVA